MAILAKHKNDVLKTLQENNVQIGKFGVKRIGLFGAFVRGQQHPESDIDLLVEFDASKKTFDNFMALSFLLEDLFGQKVELVTKESLSPYIGPQILDEVEYVIIAA